MSPNPQELVLDRPKVDDPAGSLKSFIRMVGEPFGEAGAGEGFAEVKAVLLEAIETPTVGTVDSV